jgi:phenol 2-monooxygenase
VPVATRDGQQEVPMQTIVEDRRLPANIDAQHRDLALEAMPPLLMPRKGRYGLRDHEKMFCPDLKADHDIFTMRGIDRTVGCLVIARPDQFVAQVLPLDAHGQLAFFFDRFMMPAS